MPDRVYLSNLSPLWKWLKQEKLLDERVPDWRDGCVVFRDDLDSAQRQAHQTDVLVGRFNALFRTTTRKRPEKLYVASLAVLAWTAEDMLACLTAAAARMATIHVLDVDLIIGPDADAALLHKAVNAFSEARKRSTAYRTGEAGGRISGGQRAEAAKAAAERIRERWGMPSDQYPTLALLEEAGISRNTAKLYLGKREDAQREWQAVQKRRQSAYARRGKVKP